MAALKEWAIVCQALEEGRQVVLLRKGGIMEYRQGFELKHDRFFLYPTYEHQSSESIQPDYAQKLTALLKDTPNQNKIIIKSFASALQLGEVTDRKNLDRLKKYHIWTDRYIDLRMNYNPKKPMAVVLVRTYKMDSPIEIDIKDEWNGCKSWVPLDFKPVGGHPVIDDIAFANYEKEIRGVLKEQ